MARGANPRASVSEGAGGGRRESATRGRAARRSERDAGEDGAGACRGAQSVARAWSPLLCLGVGASAATRGAASARALQSAQPARVEARGALAGGGVATGTAARSPTLPPTFAHSFRAPEAVRASVVFECAFAVRSADRARSLIAADRPSRWVSLAITTRRWGRRGRWRKRGEGGGREGQRARGTMKAARGANGKRASSKEDAKGKGEQQQRRRERGKKSSSKAGAKEKGGKGKAR